MDQREDISLGADSGCHDDQVIDENPTKVATTTNREEEEDDDPNHPQMYSSKKGGFGCKYYYHVPMHDVVDDPDFIRWDRIQI
uniref:Ovule protein n=1 Tax=Caenorhabditis tropicalis TaxID=1561998 RepID=A0A1I7UWQ9_9PELO